MNCAVHTQTPATAYCRTCGKALCDECKRDVMGAIYCEPCIAARLQGTPVVAAQAAVPDLTNPVVAGVLGFLFPGVGAWYNGQFAKGFIHVLIFASLILATVHIFWAFCFGIAAFPFYMAFEAYSTAKARQLGLPAPDPLGLDRIFGLQESQPGTQAAPSGAASSNAQPVAAVILIGLGVLFLLANFNVLPHLGRLVMPLVLIGVGVWIAYKRTAGRT
ncbi:MAG TPA: B-box zinc finger protein [Verrucomicrobiae bacterium]|nr:B-box zinc finger protein [Verrucomicrobiae bacterium]